MLPETTIQKDRKAPPATSTHHFVRASSRTRSDYREPLRSTIGIAAGQTAIEYEYRFTEYRFAEYEHDEIRCDARTLSITAKFNHCEMMQAEFVERLATIRNVNRAYLVGGEPNPNAGLWRSSFACSKSYWLFYPGRSDSTTA